MPQHEPTRKSAAKPVGVIPDKLYFRIGEVAQLCDLPAYVLRFWETEFSQLKPHKSGTGQRLYRRRDVEMVLRIKRLLYEEGYTIPGARQVFKAEAKEGPVQPELPLKFEIERDASPSLSAKAKRDNMVLRRVKKELREILGMLSKHSHEAAQRPAEPAQQGLQQRQDSV